MDLIVTAGRLVLNVGIALAVLFAVSSFSLYLFERVASRQFFQVPLLFMLAKILGAVLGMALLYEQYERDYFDLSRLFQPDSSWNISVWQFLIERTNPLFYAPITSAGAASEQWPMATLALLGGLVAVIGTLCVAAFRLWAPAEASRGIGVTMLLALWIGYVILFGVSLVLWLLFWLNVWALLVVAMVVQHFRRRI